jgi:hypothetical protein
MNLLGRITTIILLSLAPHFANATLIDHTSYTLDTGTGLEWLDVTATLGQSYNGVLGGYGGYVAAGYSYATLTDICTLFSNAGAGTAGCLGVQSNISENISLSSAQLLKSLLGETWTGGGTFGLYDAGNIPNGRVSLGCINTVSNGCLGGFTAPSVQHLYNWAGLDTSHNLVGSYLVRTTDVPEPSTLAIFALGMIGLASRRFKKQS